jgi:hypothetical protein
MDAHRMSCVRVERGAGAAEPVPEADDAEDILAGRATNEALPRDDSAAAEQSGAG